jgi:hypothetical protein
MFRSSLNVIIATESFTAGIAAKIATALAKFAAASAAKVVGLVQLPQLWAAVLHTSPGKIHQLFSIDSHLKSPKLADRLSSFILLAKRLSSLPKQ